MKERVKRDREDRVSRERDRDGKWRKGSEGKSTKLV